ncbi:hypothetical protein CYL31_02610 [Marinomonas sp. A3A]|uniref:DUF6795 domain-containing protein n=1 Tax=Marinomonas sp. A3A TaxID=2065312 RepID=UPI001BB37F81|nr:DUF6795 domain-containing protein [Marinomonas sp. A3A]QUX90358.1 hypothetical protein CYL31_02610 [Marinomonas sp. A3A]
MSIFSKKETIYLCPEVNGTLTFEGTPLVNHPIRIALVFSDKIPFNDYIYTDDQGRFHFDGYQIKSREPNSMFGSPKVTQQILTEINGERYRLWEARLPTDGTISLKMVEDQLKNINASFKKERKDTQYEYHCPELPVQPLVVLSSLELKGFN